MSPGCSGSGQAPWLQSSLRVPATALGHGSVRVRSGINQGGSRAAGGGGGGQTVRRSRAARGRAGSRRCRCFRCGAGGQGPDAAVTHGVDAGEQVAGRGDLGVVAGLLAAAGDDGVPGLADGACAGWRWIASTRIVEPGAEVVQGGLVVPFLPGEPVGQQVGTATGGRAIGSPNGR